MSENKEKEENSESEFTFFCDLLDDIDEEKKPNLTRKATKKEIDLLIKFIGGFDKWSLLNEDCRIEVIKLLDYKSRVKLSVCSKLDNEIVKKVPLKVDKIEIKDNEKSHYSFSSEEFDNVMVQVQFERDFNSGNHFELVFSQLENDTQIQWIKYNQRAKPEKRNVIWKSCNYYEEAVKFVEEWIRKSKFEIRNFNVRMANYPIEKSIIRSLPCCKYLRIGADSMDYFRWWLEKVPEKLIDVSLSPLNADSESFILSSEILGYPQIMNSLQFSLWGKAAFTDDQLINLKAKRISFDCVNITDDGLNQFLKNWVNGKSVSNFKQLLLWSTQVRDQSRITRGLEIRPWDNNFRQEARGFCDDFERCCGSGLLCQISSRIDPFESLTLCISDDRISIYATGKRMTWGGKTYTDYSIPSHY